MKNIKTWLTMWKSVLVKSFQCTITSGLSKLCNRFCIISDSWLQLPYQTEIRPNPSLDWFVQWILPGPYKRYLHFLVVKQMFNPFFRSITFRTLVLSFTTHRIFNETSSYFIEYLLLESQNKFCHNAVGSCDVKCQGMVLCNTLKKWLSVEESHKQYL